MNKDIKYGPYVISGEARERQPFHYDKDLLKLKERVKKNLEDREHEIERLRLQNTSA